MRTIDNLVAWAVAGIVIVVFLALLWGFLVIVVWSCHLVVDECRAKIRKEKYQRQLDSEQ